MENQNVTKSIILTYGIYMGIASLIVEVANYAFGDIYQKKPIIGLLGSVIFVGFIVLAIKVYKTKNNGLLAVSEAIKVALGVALIAGIIGMIYQFILMNYLEPDFIDKASIAQEQIMLEANPDMSEEELEMALSMSKMMAKPAILAALSLAGSLIGGLVIGAITGAIMKKEEKMY